MDRYPVRIEGSEVVVDTARAIRSSVDAAAWEAAEASVG
jgi:hypothetical protein